MKPIPPHPGHGADQHSGIWCIRGREPARLRRYNDAANLWCVSLRSETGEQLLFCRVHELVAEAYLAPRPEGSFDGGTAVE